MGYALLFPGQGSQSVGMLAALSAQRAVIRHVFDEAGETLGWDVGGLADSGPESELNRTEKTQPVLLAADVAVFRAWEAAGAPPPAALAGHSLGEYAALVCAGALTFADALRLVSLRGRLMQEAADGAQGAGMAAILGLDEDGVAKLCAAYPGSGLLEAANFNAPGQIVVAADRDAMAWLNENGKAHGARKVVPLAMSVPSHCSVMRDAAAKLRAALDEVDIRQPTRPVLHNLDAHARTEDDAIRDALAEQLYSPVRWMQTMAALREEGIALFLECGPGKVLMGLNKRMVEGATTLPLEEPDSWAPALQQAP